MSCRVATALLAGVLAAACSFDGGSAVNPGAGGDGGGLGGEDASLADAATPDAPGPDAAPVCLDADADGFMAGHPSCAVTLDCDDANPDAYPGQTDFFSMARASGSFDYNCDGLEEIARAEEGGDCGFQGFSCRGDGWIDEVPGCGERGTYSECGVIGLSCVEVESDPETQACR